MAGFFKKFIKKGIGVLTAGAKGAINGLPVTRAVKGVLGAAKDMVGANNKPKEKTASTTALNVSKSRGLSTSAPSDSGDNMFKRIWDWFKALKTQTPWLWWLIAILAPIVALIIIWLVYLAIRLVIRKFTRRKSAPRTSRPRSRQTQALPQASAPRKGKRRTSVAQLAALARGRAKLRAKRK